jgi:DNA-binding response OmpR family regulator
VEPDATILDLILPDGDGLDLCAAMRRSAVRPIIILSARTSEADRVCGLELGADDYVCKPFVVEELTARLRALLKRCQRYGGLETAPGEVMEVGDLRIDRTRHEVTKRGRPISLTPKEFDLLWTLAQHANHTLSQRWLLWNVWGYDEHIRTRTLDVHIGRLRRKLEDDPSRPKLIITVPAVGYRLQGQVRAGAAAEA